MKSQMTVALKVCVRQLQMSTTFWIQVKVKYPEVATKALKSLASISTSCLPEAGFFAVIATEMRLPSLDGHKQHISDITVSHPLRCNHLVAGKQTPGSL